MSVPVDPSTGLRRVGAARPFPVGPSTFGEVFDQRDTDSPAIVDGRRVWSTADVREAVERTRGHLIAAGVGPGDRVAWRLPNTADIVIAFLATVGAEAIWIGLDPRASTTDVTYALADAVPRLVLEHLPDPTASPPPPGSAPIERARPAAIAYTSGTTGRPKATVHTHQQLLYPAAAAIATERLGPSCRIITPLPLSTLNLLLLGPVTALACGGAAVIADRADADAFSATVERHRATRAVLVPTVVHDLMSWPAAADRLESLDTVLLGGAAMDPGRVAAAEELLGVRILQSYGLTEAPTGVARRRSHESAATPLPGIRVELNGDAEIVLGPTPEGPWAGTWTGALGYWRRPAATSQLWHRDRLHTGDHGELDADGRLTVHGRRADLINRGGASIAPLEIERTLRSLDGVDDAAVFGIPDQRLGEVVAAAIVGSAGPSDVDELRHRTRQLLAAHKVPSRWLFLDELPRTAARKIDRSTLEHLAVAARQDDAAD